MNYDKDDVDNLALCIWREAAGEGESGMMGVACVIRNRVGAIGFGKTLHDCIYGKNQFTSMSVPSDPEFRKYPNDENQIDLRTYDAAEKISNQVLMQNSPDITEGAHYYYNPKTANSGWFVANIVQKPAEHPETVTINHHVFFK